MENFQSSPYPFILESMKRLNKNGQSPPFGPIFFRGNSPAMLSFPTFCSWESILSGLMADMLNPTSTIVVFCLKSHFRLRGIRAGWDIAVPPIKKGRRWDGYQRPSI